MIIVVGAGGHGQVVADILRARRSAGESTEPMCFVDDDPSRHGEQHVNGVVVGSIDNLCRVPHSGVIVAVGDNAERARMFARLAAAGEQFLIARHPRSILAEDLVIGEGTMICAGAIVNTGTVVGRNAIINTGATVDHHAVVGDHVHIAPGVHIAGEVKIGEGALIGIGAVLLPRVSIGAWSTVGAGAVVTKDVPAGTTVMGVPARIAVSSDMA